MAANRRRTGRNRDDILDALSERNQRVMSEVGVQAGNYSRMILARAPSIESIYLEHYETGISASQLPKREVNSAPEYPFEDKHLMDRQAQP